MKPARFAIVACAALALAAMALDSQAGRGRGGGGRGHAASGGTAGHHHFHGGSRVFVGAGFVAWPRAYYWPGYYYPGYYYAPAVAAPAAYWYYCAAAAAYYPYVQNCPGGWELVTPTAPPYPGY